MKKILAKLIAPILVFGLIMACDDDEITGSFDTLDIPPVVNEVTPNGPVKVGEGFDIIVKVSDGEQSPLQSVSITLKDSTGAELGVVTIPVSGTADSVGWAAAENGSAGLTVANYTITVVATDIANLSSAPFDQAFSVFDLPFNANIASLWILGGFSGWGGAEDGSDREDYAFTLVADNIWQLDELKGVGSGDGFKFSTSPSFADGSNAYSDPECDGVAGVFNGPGNDTFCEFKGDYKVTFNDESLSYTFEPLVALQQNLSELYLLTSRTGFVASDDEAFRLDSDNTWLLEEIILTPGNQVFFSEDANLGGGGKVYGDNDASDTTATAGGPAYVIPDTWTEGYYAVAFNDDTEGYKFTFLRGLFPSQLYLVGGSTGAGWTATDAIAFESTGEGLFRTYQYLTVDGDGFKFLPTNTNFDGDYGDGGSGSLVQDGEGNVTVATDGFYRVDVDFINGTWSTTASEFGIIGDATPGGWDADTNMTLVSATKGSYAWSITTDLLVGQMKFRENDDWAINYGDWDPEDGVLDFNPNGDGANINVPTAGNFTITLTLDSENGYTYTIE